MANDRILRLLRVAARFLLAPCRPVSLTSCARDFQISKTMMGEDIAILDEAFREEGLGRVVVGRGRIGGACFQPEMSAEQRTLVLTETAHLLAQEDRLLPGGMLYYGDILFSPVLAMRLGQVIASLFAEARIDTVLTTEVKGIPLGLFAAFALGVPLAVCRFRNRPSDGSAVAVHYPTASGEVRTMYMGMRHLERGARVLLVDDFMKGGSTLSGMLHVVREFDAHVAGSAIFLVSDQPQKKFVNDYTALLNLSTAADGRVQIRLSDSLLAP